MQSILQQTSHRPFALPDSPWVMRQSWDNLLFAHWPIAATELRDSIPAGLEIDTYDQYAWIAVVPFAMNDVCPRYLSPLPWISNFLELNVRTYVVKNGVPGVYFFSLDCSNPVAVRVARQFFHLPYFDAKMSLNFDGNEVIYKSSRTSSGQIFEARYYPVGKILEPTKDSIEHFLTERYCLYTTDKRGRIYQGVIHHLPWTLQIAQAEIQTNTMISADLGFTLPKSKPLLHFSKSIDTVEWWLRGMS
ncbi:MAG: DUF2071 domain-containing protein [Candidatus Obscuribacterales bacterium]|nr:DUF2071 domain-containing protein [Candidatus Obscuribacterales bacterium]